MNPFSEKRSSGFAIFSLLDDTIRIYILCGYTDFRKGMNSIIHDGKEMTCDYYSIVRTAQFNGLVPYEYLVYLFDSLPYREDKSFDYTSYLPWAEGIIERVKEHIANKFKN